jgi:2-polyprenyl-3-methyl-5-hydroxy-6-metoxy-1,4-benzoquinol methylase
MKLWQTRRHWEKFARTDPMWAVLTDPEKAGNRWTRDEFFATGRQEVDAIMARVKALYPALREGAAFDFGCGVGRLTQGLAAHFERATGVDISERMIELARTYNAHGTRVDYVHNTRGDLAAFADGAFDFTFSLITLQHIAPEYSRRYIAELIRLCTPGGAAWFQVPDRLAQPKRARISFYPPTVAKKLWRRLNAYLVVQPAMEMHVRPREEVIALVQAAGGQIVAIDSSASTGPDFVNYAYLVRKM